MLGADVVMGNGMSGPQFQYAVEVGISCPTHKPACNWVIEVMFLQKASAR